MRYNTEKVRKKRASSEIENRERRIEFTLFLEFLGNDHRSYLYLILVENWKNAQFHHIT